jgi:hypothetical protein
MDIRVFKILKLVQHVSVNCRFIDSLDMAPNTQMFFHGIFKPIIRAFVANDAYLLLVIISPIKKY